jgi:glycosyltransferase involved in cell wall biosynthesis
MHQSSENSKIRVAMLVTRMDIGGVPDHVMTLLDGFRSNIEVTLITDRVHPNLRNNIEALGINIVILPMKRLLDIKTDIKAIRVLYRILKEGQFHILHTHMSKAALLGAITGVFSRKIIVVNTAHNFGFIAMPVLWKKVIFWIYDKLISTVGIDATITVSQKVGDAVVKAKLIPYKRVNVIPNGIRLQEFLIRASEITNFRDDILGKTKDGLIIICIARLVWFKGLDNLINAFGNVSKMFPNAHLAIVGDGELLNSLTEQAHQLSVENLIHFCGERHDVPAILAASDILVLSSVSEGLPISLLEGMAARLPVVATDVGGVSELIVPEKTGYLVPSGDVDKLASAISLLLDNRDTRREFGDAGYERLERKFSQNAMVTQTEMLYQRMINSGSREFADA